jgi:hypothetical protein
MMIRIDRPVDTYRDSIEKVQQGITGNSDLRRKVKNNRENWDIFENVYILFSEKKFLKHIGALQAHRKKDPLVIHTGILKSEMITLYSTYFSNREKPAYEIYERIMLSASESCPYCGGIGDPQNLDHYMPKKYYPQYAVLPLNLVPSCRDCNMGSKGDSPMTSDEHRILNPYIDGRNFFEEQWIFADFLLDAKGTPVSIEYRCDPPSRWSDVDKKRAKNHFEVFNLKRKYIKAASTQINVSFSQVDILRDIGTSKPDIIKVCVTSSLPSKNKKNTWHLGFYQALEKWIVQS